eukprot:228138_1
MLRIPKKAIPQSGKDPKIETNKCRTLYQHNSNKKLNVPRKNIINAKKPPQKRTLIRNTISDDDDDDDDDDSDKSLEPSPKRRRKNDDQNNNRRKKKRKTKGPKMRFCVICEEKLHDDNKGKYCGELCKKEASEKRKAERAQEKKEKEEREELYEEEMKAKKEKENNDNIRKKTKEKFSEIFGGDKTAGNNLEKRIYKLSDNDINNKYTEKVRQIAFNLNENKALLNRVLRGEITLKQLSLMNNDIKISNDSSDSSESDIAMDSITSTATGRGESGTSLDDRVMDMSKMSAVQKKAWLERKEKPNAFYYRFNANGEKQASGEWNNYEHKEFMERVMEFGVNFEWGIFSKVINGRVGYQCSNYWRKLMDDGYVKDENYVMEKGKNGKMKRRQLKKKKKKKN